MSTTNGMSKEVAVRTPKRSEPRLTSFRAVDTWWSEGDAEPWGCPIGVELAMEYRHDDEAPE